MRWNASHGFEPTERPRRGAKIAGPDLHVCPACARTFVVPNTVLEATGPGTYLVELRCMNCAWIVVRPESEERLEALDRELDSQIADLEEMAVLLELTRVVEKIDAFAQALHDGHILPEDF